MVLVVLVVEEIDERLVVVKAVISYLRSPEAAVVVVRTSGD